jgi:hypothetical protein
LSVPVLSRSLIEGRADTRQNLGQLNNGNPRSPENRTEFAPKSLFRPAGRNSRFLRKARPPRPPEPILIPKLRIQFADFPYLHYSIDQRLLTLETCCGYGYELVRNRRHLHPNFQGPTERSWTLRELQGSSPQTKTHSPCERIPGTRRLMQKRQLFPEFRWASLGHFVLPRQIKDSTGYATRLWNMDHIPFRPRFGFSQVSL